MPTIWLVDCILSDYDDYVQRTVMAHGTKKAADEHCRLANEELERIAAEKPPKGVAKDEWRSARKGYRWSGDYYPTNRYDPMFNCSRDEAAKKIVEYWVVEVPLVEHWTADTEVPVVHVKET